MLAWPSWLFGEASLREDAAPTLEAADIAAGSLQPPIALTEPPTTGRRDRAMDGSEPILVDTLAAKVLHGWLQNRHQTLYPLTVNLRQLDPDGSQALARWLAVALLANRHPDDRAAGTRSWFTSVGASPEVMLAVDAALATPPALSAALADIARHDLAAYAYVVALVALNPADPAALPFLDYVAARLTLPTSVVRSATRRFRR